MHSIENNTPIFSTDYGIKKNGNSHFVVIAPHAGGDDLRTGVLAILLAKQLDSFLVVNKKFIKKNNTHAKSKPEKIEDFNKLYWWSRKKKYLWHMKKPEMKLFYKDVRIYCQKARKYSQQNKAVAIYLHGMRSNKIAIDIGAGAKKIMSKNKITQVKRKYKQSNTGEITLKISNLKNLKKNISERVDNKFNLPTTIGFMHSGWSKTSAIQLHRHTKIQDYSLQFEICQLLRTKKNFPFLVNILTKALKETFI